MTNQSDGKMKACPFCGGQFHIVRGPELYAGCEGCGITTKGRSLEASVVLDVNTRPSADSKAATPDELKSSHAVHMNMLLGFIAKLTPAQVAHLYSDAECAEIVREIKRQRPEATPDEQTMGEVREAPRKAAIKGAEVMFDHIAEQQAKGREWQPAWRVIGWHWKDMEKALLEPKPSGTV